MPQVASCPQCNHDLLVPDEADREAWAKCPECRAFFQVHQAAARELPAILLVDSHEADDDGDSDAASRQTDTLLASAASEETAISEPQPPDDLAAAADRIDEWFRSAKSTAEAPSSAGRADTVAFHSPAAEDTIEVGASSLSEDTAFASSGPTNIAATSPPIAPWDDASGMARLLADIEQRPEVGADEAVATESPADGAGNGEPLPSTASSVTTQELPKFVTPARAPRRRERSVLRTFVTSAVAGVVGLALGYYALLWMRGTSGDLLDLAQYLPKTMLPAEFQTDGRGAPPFQRQVADPIEESHAAYTTPASPQAFDSQAERRDQYEEPASFEPPPAAPLAHAPSLFIVAPVADAPSFTAEELAAALEAARPAQAALLTGNLTDGKEIQQAKGRGYMQLAELAENATFVDARDATTPVAALQQSAVEVFRQTLSLPHIRGEVGLIAPRWVAAPNRTHGGVFFAASLTNPESRGTVTECQAELDGGQSLTVLVPDAMAELLDASARPMGIVGWVVDQPAERISGYTGSAPQAIWASALIPLD